MDYQFRIGWRDYQAGGYSTTAWITTDRERLHSERCELAVSDSNNELVWWDGLDAPISADETTMKGQADDLLAKYGYRRTDHPPRDYGYDAAGKALPCRCVGDCNDWKTVKTGFAVAVTRVV